MQKIKDKKTVKVLVRATQSSQKRQSEVRKEPDHERQAGVYWGQSWEPEEGDPG